MVARVSRRVGNTSKGNMCRPESLPVRARLGTRQKCRGNARPWHTFKRHRSCRLLHFKHGKGPFHPQKALRACLRWMIERPIASSQASRCPCFPICTRFFMPGQPSSGQNRQNFNRRAPFRPSCAPLLAGGALMPMPGRSSMYMRRLRYLDIASGAHLVSSGTKKDKSSCLGPVQTAHRF